MKPRKVLLLAKWAECLGFNSLGLLIYRIIYRNEWIRVINYHSTPEIHMYQFEEQIKYYSDNYCSVSKQDLWDLLEGRWSKDKPGLIISFDDGLESNYLCAKPILEKYGFIGWFFIPAGLIETGYCQKSDLTGSSSERYMSWTQVRDLHAHHVVGCHTLTHKRLGSDLSDTQLSREIEDSKLLLEEELGDEMDIFCWVGGEFTSYSKRAAEAIKEAGYCLSFLTNHYPVTKRSNPLLLERTNVEANWPISLVRFYTSALMDLKYWRKRREVRKIIDSGTVPDCHAENKRKS